MDIQDLKEQIRKHNYSPHINPNPNKSKDDPDSTPIPNPIFSQTILLAIPYPQKLIYPLFP